MFLVNTILVLNFRSFGGMSSRLVNMINLFPVNFQLEKLVSEDSLHYDVICFHYYIQFHLHVQVRTDDLFC